MVLARRSRAGPPIMISASRGRLDHGGAQTAVADNWRPLLAIADAAGGTWPDRMRQIATTAVATPSERSIRVLLLSDIQAAFKAKGCRLSSEEFTGIPDSLDEQAVGRGAVTSHSRNLAVTPAHAIRNSVGNNPARQRSDAKGTTWCPSGTASSVVSTLKTPPRHNPITTGLVAFFNPPSGEVALS